MGTLTRAQLASELQFRLGGRTDIPAELITALQFAYSELVTSIRIPENQESAVMIAVNTNSGNPTYALPTDLYAPMAIRNTTDGERLSPLTIRQYDRLRDTTTQGKSTHYVWWRNEVTFWPPPDGTARTILLRYLKRLPNLTADGSVSALPTEWDEVIIQGAFFRVLDWLKLPQEAQAAMAAFQGMVQRRIDRLGEGEFDQESTAKPVLVEPTLRSRW